VAGKPQREAPAVRTEGDTIHFGQGVGGSPSDSDAEMDQDEYGRGDEWRWYKDHAAAREIKKAPRDVTEEELLTALLDSEKLLVAAVNANPIIKTLPYECFKGRENGKPGDANGFPIATFLEAWNEDAKSDLLDSKDMKEMKDAFETFMNLDARFGGYRMSEELPTSVWISDPLMLTDQVTMPVSSCFAKADYGALVVRSLLHWKCIPPIYPRHTMHEDWFAKIDILEQTLWSKPTGPDALDVSLFNRNRSISKGMELRKLFESFESMVWTIRIRVGSHNSSDLDNGFNGEKHMDIVDEIYLTEQLCNFFYGVRYIVDKDRLRNGHWVSIEHLNDIVRACAFVPRSEEYYENPNDIRIYVLYPDLIDRVWKTVDSMMDFCIGLDFRLPYLRVNELRERYKAREASWPRPNAGSVPALMRPRVFWLEWNV
jgi:hypothetical protein